MTDKERFGGKCPYNGSPCETFHCSKCVIEEQEREFMGELKGAAMNTIRVTLKTRPWDVAFIEHKKARFSIREDIKYLEIYSEAIDGIQEEGTCFYNLDEIERFEIIRSKHD